MERFPTWNIWRLLHRYQALEMYEMSVRLLRVKRPASGRAQLSNIWIWVGMNILTSIIMLVAAGYLLNPSFGVIYLIGFVVNDLNLILPVLTTFVSLRYALQVTDAIAKQRELGSYDLFALLPAGEAANILNIACAYRHPLQGIIHGAWSALAVLFLIVFYLLWLLIGIRYTANSPSDEASWLFLITMVTHGLMAFVDYLQSFVAAFLLAVLTSERERRANAWVWLVSTFLALQSTFYLVLNVVLSLLGVGLLTDIRLQRLFFLWTILIQPLIFILCRELVNFALWQAVKRRLEA